VLALALGEMARETLLTGARVEPRRLLDGGYRFARPRLDDTLQQILGAGRSAGSPSK
jgi:NAD dependent epimerase/dehydratase family enzyme